MSQSQREEVRQKIRDLDRELNEKIKEERERQNNFVAKYQNQLEKADAAFSQTDSRAKDASLNHLSAMNNLKIQEDARTREAGSIHLQTLDENRKAAAKGLEC
uniref:Uncharacterized protein n=1 Tax=Caenorhabditis japonica TaxID=281687 RepID=A0A8R1DYN8_CAEJA